MTDNFIKEAIEQFRSYKSMAERVFAQINNNDFFYKPNEVSNSIANIICHLHGNMLSRWTNFLLEDGEKEWRNRDEEFVNKTKNKDELLLLWNDGWLALFDALNDLTSADLNKIVYIRSKPLNVLHAILRQLTHYSSHVGQIIYLGKIITGENWQTLSIAQGDSKNFNERMKNS